MRCFLILALAMVLHAADLTTSVDRDGNALATLHNRDVCELTSYVIVFHSSSGSGYQLQPVIRDTILTGRSFDAIPPQETRSVPFPWHFKVAQTDLNWAGLCDSGLVSGDPALSELLLSRRRQVRKDIPEARRLIEGLERRQAAPKEVGKVLRDWANRGGPLSERPLPHYLADLVDQQSLPAAGLLRYLAELEARGALENVSSR